MRPVVPLLTRERVSWVEERGRFQLGLVTVGGVDSHRVPDRLAILVVASTPTSDTATWTLSDRS